MIRSSLFFFLVFFVCLTPLGALDWIGADTGLLLLLNSEEDSAPGPLMNTFGASMPFWTRPGPLYWDGSLLFFHTYYQYEGDRPTPAEREKSNTLLTIGMLVESRFGYSFQLTEKLALGGAAGLALVFRFPLFAIEEGGENRGPAFSYLMTRFLYPQLEMRLIWDVLETLGLGISFRGLFPFFHIWGGGAVPFYDQFIIMGNLEFRIRLPIKRKEADES